MTTHHLTPEQLRATLNYDPQTGVFTRRIRTSNRIKVGDVAGSTDSKGYRQIRVGGRLHLAHRLAWLHVHGDWPASELDHVNGERDDNRIANLREVSREANMQNRHRAIGSAGLLGVTPRKHGRYEARITVNGVAHCLGYFATAEDAHDAYQRARRDSLAA